LTQIRPDTDRVAFGVVVGDNGFRVAGYDVFAGTGGGIVGTSQETARRADRMTHDQSFFLLVNGDTSTRSGCCGTSSPTAPS
jgi:PhnB protein